jgi:ABC-type Fe3+ transport system permease subunit
MARDGWRHILTTLPLFWCGLWVSGLFAVALLPVFAVALVAAVRRRNFMLLFYAAPGLVLALAYAVLANHYPRYNLGLIGPIAVAAAWLMVAAWRRARSHNSGIGS